MTFLHSGDHCKRRQTNSRSNWGIRLAAVMGLGFGPGCGTQTGNPPSQLSQFFSLENVTTLVNGMFAEGIDSLNMGDYLYSASESRVINSQYCLTPGDGVSRLQRLTATEHSVDLETADRSTTVELDIVRTYTDSWQKNGEALPCEVEASALDLLPGDQLVLLSTIDEVHQRQLTVEKKRQAETLTHFADRRKIGDRMLAIQVQNIESGLLWLEGEVDESELERRLLLPLQDDGRIRQLNLTADQGFALNFRVAMDAASRELESYEIELAQLNYKSAEGQTLQITITGLKLELADHCFPKQGQVEIVLQEDEVRETLSLDFAAIADQDFASFTSSFGRSIGFFPEACVLSER